MTTRVDRTVPVAEKVAKVLEAATDYMTVEQICQVVFGRKAGERERNTIYVALHRMGPAVEKRAAGYRRRLAAD